MRPVLLLLSVAFIGLTLSSFSKYSSTQSITLRGDRGGNTIKGIVVNAAHLPVANVLVYTIEGEEEALTNEKGQFRFETRKSFPVEVIAQELSGKRKKVKTTAQTGTLTIELP